MNANIQPNGSRRADQTQTLLLRRRLHGRSDRARPACTQAWREPDRNHDDQPRERGAAGRAARTYGVVAPRTTDERKHGAPRSGRHLLGMKPKDAAEALRRSRPALRAGAADRLRHRRTVHRRRSNSCIGRRLPIARTMPNTSSTIGLGATGISFSPMRASDEQRELALSDIPSRRHRRRRRRIAARRRNRRIGQRPAYIYYMMEAMIEAAVALGLRRKTRARA